MILRIYIFLVTFFLGSRFLPDYPSSTCAGGKEVHCSNKGLKVGRILALARRMEQVSTTGKQRSARHYQGRSLARSLQAGAATKELRTQEFFMVQIFG